MNSQTTVGDSQNSDVLDAGFALTHVEQMTDSEWITLRDQLYAGGGDLSLNIVVVSSDWNDRRKLLEKLLSKGHVDDERFIVAVLASFARENLASFRAEYETLQLDKPRRGELLRKVVLRDLESALPTSTVAPLPVDALLTWAQSIDKVPKSTWANMQAVALIKRAIQQRDEASLNRALEAIALADRIDLIEQKTINGDSVATCLADVVGKTVPASFVVREKLAPQFHKLKVDSKNNQRLLSMLFAYQPVRDDRKLFLALMKFVPNKIDNQILAYNLACGAAHYGERRALFKYTKQALALGKKPKQFREDQDFAGFMTDDKFTAWLDGTRGPLAKQRRARELSASVKMFPHIARAIFRSMFSGKYFVVAIALATVVALVDYFAQLGNVSYFTLLMLNGLFCAAGMPMAAIAEHWEHSLHSIVKGVGFVAAIAALIAVKYSLYTYFSIVLSNQILMAILSPVMPFIPFAVVYLVLTIAWRNSGPHH